MASVGCLHAASHRNYGLNAFSNLCPILLVLRRPDLRLLNRSSDRSVPKRVGFCIKDNQLRDVRVLMAGTRGDGGGSTRPGPNHHKRGSWWCWFEQMVPSQEFRVLLFQLGILLLLMRLLRPASVPEPKVRPAVQLRVPYSEFLGQVAGNQVEKVEIDGARLKFKLRHQQRTGYGDFSNIASAHLQESSGVLLRNLSPGQRIVYVTTRPADIKTPYEKMLENGVEFGSPEMQSGGYLNMALITLFYAAVLLAFLHQLPMRSSSSQHSVGQFRTRKCQVSGSSKAPDNAIVRFSDIAGVDEAREELEEIVEFLRNPERYLRVGARTPRGVLLVGPPGTGKTLLAKAVAGEADVPFVSCCASEFIEMYVGMGASRVRDLFAEAKKQAPSIIFIDEIDAVAKSRDGKFRIVSNDEREQTLNQLLTEMDGFNSDSTVIVIGATNRADVLDPALRRPGRFDRVVVVELPDRTGREAILKVHVSNNQLPLGEDVNLRDVASMTPGFTGADLANLVNEAALLAGRQNKVMVQQIDFVRAVERSIAGIEKKTAKLHRSEKAVIARHEAGHAIVSTAVAKLLPGQTRVEKVSVLPRSGGALGFTYAPTIEDRYLLFVDELRGRLATLLGGRAAEQVVYSGRVSTGALDDIRRATDMAYKAVAEYGFDQAVGPVSVSALSGCRIDESVGVLLASERRGGQLIDLVHREVKELLISALDAAIAVIRVNDDILERLGKRLEENEKVEGEELREWLDFVVVPNELAAFVEGQQKLRLLREQLTNGSRPRPVVPNHDRASYRLPVLSEN